ncbi:unnamed protein product [Tuber melanosporum]|uniref:rRNA adenine N(6)-methyltransferase n=1 Tax=Tuber melanosporum (strain Mel28) TaxID=656061 RepID=D5GDV9_TUBMM|nr:uncharacterized protein GSTUM_00006301001 [Tuber melanosporum]CAZ82702.1 unnamed protein product [Tuber melanosporum]
MTAASIFRRSADESIAHLRSLISPYALSRRSKLPPSLVNWQICDPIMDKLNLLAYKKTTIIDMNPNLGVFSAALHERLQPKQHILLEPEEFYGDRMREFQKTYKNSWYIPLDGYDWNTYNQLFSDNPPPPPWPDNFPKPRIQATTSPDDVNSDLLFVGHMGKSEKSERLIAQFINCCALGTWIQQYGRVRFLLWVPDSIKDRYLPRSIASRARPAASAEAVVDITEVASSNVIRTGRGFQKLPEINPDNVEVEEKRLTSIKPQERKVKIKKKLVIRQKMVEDEIKKLVAELCPGLTPTTRGRPKKLPSKEQKKLEETRARVRELVEAIRNEEPILPASIPCKERVTVLNRCDEIRRRFEHKKGAEEEAEKIPEKENKRKWKLRVPRAPGRPRKLPKQGEPPSIAQIEAIEDKIMNYQGLWIQGMEHPPWYYKNDKAEIRKLALEMATLHPALGVDPKQVLQPEDVYETAMGAGGSPPNGDAAVQEPSATSASETNWSSQQPGKTDSMGGKGDKDTAEVWEEYAERWARRHEVKARAQSRDDEIYAVRNRLLNIHNREYEPLPIKPAEDFFPDIPMSLLEITPKKPHPFFSVPNAHERENNWLIFVWLLRHLFVLRASSILNALRSLAPGAENILEHLPADERIPPSKRVRCLGTIELVNLAMAWKRWPFKDPDTQFQHIEEGVGERNRFY